MTPRRRRSQLSSISRTKARQKFPLIASIFRSRAKNARVRPILYHSCRALNNATWSSRDAKTSGTPRAGNRAPNQPRVIHQPGRGPSRSLGMTSMSRSVIPGRSGDAFLLPAVSMKIDLSLFARKFLCQPRTDVCENLFRRGLWR